jgi:hypothetical protein
MSRDLKHRVPAFRQRKPRRVTARHGIVLFGGFLFVAVLAAGYQHYTVPGHDLPVRLAGVTVPTPAPEPGFSFFKLLQDSEKMITEGDINAMKRDERLGKPPVAGRYFLQAGSFPHKEQAQDLKARLETMDRLKPRLEMIKLEYATWYRVKLGPYRTLPDADRVRLYLRDQQIDSIIQTPVE